MIDRLHIGVGRAVGGGLLWLSLTADPARAQRAVSGTPTTQSGATAVVPFLWQTQPGVLTVITKSRAKCTPGECFSQFVGVRANAGWRLQVKLMVPTSGFTVDLSTSARPSTSVVSLSATSWTPTGISGSSTANQTGEVTFYGKKSSGPSGRVPTATDLGALIQYQVVRVP